MVAEEALEGCGQLLLSFGTLRLAGGFAFALSAVLACATQHTQENKPFCYCAPISGAAQVVLRREQRGAEMGKCGVEDKERCRQVLCGASVACSKTRSRK
jgi:hypothetical protein